MRAAQIACPGERFEIVEREIPQRGADWCESMNEVLLEKVASAYERIMSGEPRFRVLLATEN